MQHWSGCVCVCVYKGCVEVNYIESLGEAGMALICVGLYETLIIKPNPNLTLTLIWP